MQDAPFLMQYWIIPPTLYTVTSNTILYTVYILCMPKWMCSMYLHYLCIDIVYGYLYLKYSYWSLNIPNLEIIEFNSECIAS